MIKVTAAGNIGKDAELKTISNDLSVTTFSIASNKKIKGEDVTTWLMCRKWNSDKLTPYLTKGTKVIVSGDLEIREHEGKYYTTLNVYELEFAGKPEQQSITEQYKEKDRTLTSDNPPQPGGDDLPF